MTLYLADAPAVEYWRRADPSAKTRARAATPFGQDRETPPFSASDLAALEEAGVGWLSEPIHLLVPDASSRRRCKRTKLHVCSHRLPERSFVKLSRHVMVASPELTCLSIAPSTPFPLLVEFLYELCGRYRLPDGRGGDATELPPATTVAGIERFADKARGVRGAADVKRALRYACDNSLSPMETDIAETMVFDPRMGGLGLEKPQLNPRFEVTRKNRRALPQSAYLPDLFWPRANISVEYDSDKHHRGDRKASEDAIRRNGIEHLGTRVVTLTWGQARPGQEVRTGLGRMGKPSHRAPPLTGAAIGEASAMKGNRLRPSPQHPLRSARKPKRGQVLELCALASSKRAEKHHVPDLCAPLRAPKRKKYDLVNF